MSGARGPHRPPEGASGPQLQALKHRDRQDTSLQQGAEGHPTTPSKSNGCHQHQGRCQEPRRQPCTPQKNYSETKQLAWAVPLHHSFPPALPPCPPRAAQAGRTQPMPTSKQRVRLETHLWQGKQQPSAAKCHSAGFPRAPVPAPGITHSPRDGCGSILPPAASGVRVLGVIQGSAPPCPYPAWWDTAPAQTKPTSYGLRPPSPPFPHRAQMKAGKHGDEEEERKGGQSAGKSLCDLIRSGAEVPAGDERAAAAEEQRRAGPLRPSPSLASERFAAPSASSPRCKP